MPKQHRRTPRRRPGSRRHRDPGPRAPSRRSSARAHRTHSDARAPPRDRAPPPDSERDRARPRGTHECSLHGARRRTFDRRPSASKRIFAACQDFMLDASFTSVGRRCHRNLFARVPPVVPCAVATSFHTANAVPGERSTTCPEKDPHLAGIESLRNLSRRSHRTAHQASSGVRRHRNVSGLFRGGPCRSGDADLDALDQVGLEGIAGIDERSFIASRWLEVPLSRDVAEPDREDGHVAGRVDPEAQEVLEAFDADAGERVVQERARTDRRTRGNRRRATCSPSRRARPCR